MGIVDVGVEKTHRERFHSRTPQGGGFLPGTVRHQGCLHLTVSPHALADLAPQLARYQRCREFQGEFVEIVAILAADFQNIAAALRGEESGRCALAFDEAIGDERRGVDDGFDRTRRHLDVGEPLGDALHHPFCRVARRGQAFVHRELERVRVQ